MTQNRIQLHGNHRDTVVIQAESCQRCDVVDIVE